MPSLSQCFALIPALYLVAVATPLTVIDLREHRLPNRLVLPVFPIALLAQTVATTIEADWVPLISAVALALATFIVGLIANYFDLLGMGDVKLGSGIALVLGFFAPLLPVISIGLAFVLAFLVICIQLARGKVKIGSSIPLGPYLLLSCFGSLAWQLLS